MKMRFGTYKMRMAIRAIRRPFLRRSGPIARLLRYPNPLKWRPWKGEAINELARNGALGDVLMCTPVLRELKRRNPHCHIRFYTNFGPLVNGLPYIDEVLPYEQKAGRRHLHVLRGGRAARGPSVADHRRFGGPQGHRYPPRLHSPRRPGRGLQTILRAPAPAARRLPAPQRRLDTEQELARSILGVIDYFAGL